MIFSYWCEDVVRMVGLWWSKHTLIDINTYFLLALSLLFLLNYKYTSWQEVSRWYQVINIGGEQRQTTTPYTPDGSFSPFPPGSTHPTIVVVWVKVRDKEVVGQYDTQLVVWRGTYGGIMMTQTHTHTPSVVSRSPPEYICVYWQEVSWW